ncbi:tRNA (adenosine(37)-N6)-threonylcarbamoyltransferase complex dimerization subunit type 1 TsaB [Roseimaritima ulvae]|uniref:tRNA threonylcarbamoyladenosine biosynthesis protein TsaB n=1 Tax=Roseimaritima ulvae TaxID=980254 RepID=A0A5B9QYY3_9BACT|nr:tRNA (adenosine(37)-N6)-threonylcarbamoyltransferase complex dimerization subunit type 1 TsaB [Roseimaritima ulvae]QEG42366.1 tRNA threonylcarbamoyladenosine biosynthesis protein TsaB [Roseimaritima ulvae]
MSHWHLAIETSGRHGSLALLDGDQLLREVALEPQQRTAASLFPAMEELLQQVRASGEPLQQVSVASGPGSFTGLRIGVTAAKTLAYAMKCQLVAVDALEVIAQQAFDHNESLEQLWVGVKAYRGQIFARGCARQNTAAGESLVLSGPQWRQQVSTLPAGWGLTGDAAGDPSLEISSKIFLVDPQYWQPTASTVGRLAAGAEPIDPLRLVPEYLRPSAAEEKLNS